jgi:hypothetical protein
MVGQILEELVEGKGEACTINGQGTQNLLAQIGSSGVLWIPGIESVLPLLGGNN